MNETASAVLKGLIIADDTGKKYTRSDSGKTRYFTSLPQVVNFLLKTFATNIVIAEFESNITHFVSPSKMTPSQFTAELVTKALQHGDVYEE